jgi:hypothetical protein
MIGDERQHDGRVIRLTVRMWFSSSVDMACAYSVFSFAMRVRLLISGLLFNLKSWRASRKSAATSAAGNDMMGSKRKCLCLCFCVWVRGVDVRREMQLLESTAIDDGQSKQSRPVLQTEQTDASSLSNTGCDRMFVLLLAKTSLVPLSSSRCAPPSVCYPPQIADKRVEASGREALLCSTRARAYT